jgi:hypothetical protein
MIEYFVYLILVLIAVFIAILAWRHEKRKADNEFYKSIKFPKHDI